MTVRLLLLSQSTTVHALGGMQTHAEATARVAVKLGHDVVLLTTSHRRGLLEEIRNGVRVEYLPGTPPGLNSRAWWGKSTEAVRRLLNQGFGDLILSVSLAGYGVATSGIRVPHYAFAYGETLAHLISEWHNWSDFRSLALYPTKAFATFYGAFLERRLWSRLDGVIATHDLLYQKLCRLGYPAYLSYNGIDVSHFAPDERLRETTRQTLGIEPSASVLLMLGTVNRQKGLWLGAESFLSLAARYPDLHLLVVGDGPDLPRLRRRLGAEPLSRRIHLVGAAPLDEVPAFYAASDIFLYPTLRMEGLPYAVLYALAAALPVVASDRGGIASAVKDEVTGLLVPAGDRQTLTLAVERLLENPLLARSLSGRAREYAVANFDAQPLAARLLRELIGKR